MSWVSGPLAARLPEGGARGCCPRLGRRGADAVAMVMELRSCPLSAQQLPGRGLRADPANPPGGSAVDAGTGAESPAPLPKRNCLCLRLRLPAGSAHLGALARLLPPAGTRQTPAQRAARSAPSRPGERAPPPPPPPGPQLARRPRCACARRPPAAKPRPRARWACAGRQRPARRPRASLARGAPSMLSLRVGVGSCPPEVGDWAQPNVKGPSRPLGVGKLTPAPWLGEGY